MKRECYHMCHNEKKNSSSNTDRVIHAHFTNATNNSSIEGVTKYVKNTKQLIPTT